MNISEITKGQIITRVEPRTYYNYTTGGCHTDNRFIGEKLTYHGLANGMIVLSRNENEVLCITIHEWEEGWEFFIDPLTLVEGSKDMIVKTLQVKLFEAVENENYLEARRIQNELDGKTDANQKRLNG